MSVKAAEVVSDHKLHSISVATEAEAREWLTGQRNAFLARHAKT